MPEKGTRMFSYNGWLASPNPADFGGLSPLVVAGESFAPGVRSGDVFTVLQYVAEQMNARVEPVYAPGWHEQDDWGFSYRKNRNANNLSCHSSGTAIDYNATRHPNGTRDTYSKAQVAEIRRILAEVDHVVDWGGDWGPNSTPDWMHFEISGSPAEVARVAARIRGGVPAPDSGIHYEDRVDAAPGARVLELGKVGSDVEFVQRWHGIAADGYFGPATQAKVKETQARNHVEVDGVVGPVTWRLMGVGKRQAPPFPLPAGHYYGLLTGPNESHGGFYANERDEVAAIQRELIRQGCVPGITDPDRTGWDDGRFEGATADAVRRFQRSHGLAVDGEVGPKTWAVLFGG